MVVVDAGLWMRGCGFRGCGYRTVDVLLGMYDSTLRKELLGHHINVMQNPSE